MVLDVVLDGERGPTRAVPELERYVGDRLRPDVVERGACVRAWGTSFSANRAW